ncbi:MAG: peptidylprolyl isomerase [Chloroflexi bacterium]|nr:peptidylprolyl isomerase [Chloroflexota bacterium]MBR91243.1 peptidylprolyl isomerase [Dehalococcoidia bacterium]MQG08901.1 peptidylprolyl isomerase [SAR202 cluster bacterium]|tara:strand:+ start:36 stop:599 length:564 start_codon:yes stop_codon:yes gene_type:complete
MFFVSCAENSKNNADLVENKNNLIAPQGNLDISKTYYAEFNTDSGKFTVQLYDDLAPYTVENFINLSENNFYNGTTFHRVIPGFMAQGGDPTGTGSGGPGYKFDDEINDNLSHDKAGILSMANAGPGTNGSQFFITFSPTPHLDGMHTIFGHVVSGLENVMKITPRDPFSASEPGDRIIKIIIKNQP